MKKLPGEHGLVKTCIDLRELRPLRKKLREIGFALAWKTNAGGLRTEQFEKTIGAGRARRRLEVKLWGDGRHRATHMHAGLTPNGMVGDTRPTDFTTVDEMLLAIERESTRTDYPS
jgi:hypothetical protein